MVLNILSLERTKLANHRTYLAYMRTGLVVASIAIQYLYTNYKLENKERINNIIHYFPIIYCIFTIAAIILQFKVRIKIKIQN